MAPDDDDRTPRVPLGPVGRNVQANLSWLRGRVTYRELSDRLAGIGRPIPVLGLSRIEKGTRRVDVDDLVGLAIVLGVSPVQLLLPAPDHPQDEDDAVELTSEVALSTTAAQQWMTGQALLPASDVITWERRPHMYRVREGEIAEMRKRLNFLEHALSLQKAREDGGDGSEAH